MQAFRRLLGATITIRQLTSVFLSRVAAGILLAATPFVLRSIWTPYEFHAYVSAVTPFAFVYPLISGGQQKSALRLLPRTRLARRQATGTYLMCLAVISVAVIVWIGFTGKSHNSSLLLLAGFFLVLRALRQSAVTMHRAMGRPMIETYDQIITALLMAGGIAAAATITLSPTRLLLFWSCSSLVIAIIELSLLLHLERPIYNQKLTPMIARDIALQGAGDAFSGALMTVLYLIVADVAGPNELARLYVVLSFASLLTAGYTYALRLVQPAMSLRIRHTSITFTEIKWYRSSQLVVICTTYAVAVLIAGRELNSLTNLGATATLVFALLALMPVLALVGMVNFIFENLSAKALLKTVYGAAAGVVVASSVAIPLVAWLGALGALGAIIIGEISHLAYLLNVKRRDESSSRIRRVMAALPEETKARRAELT